jgi:predicted HTH transcriptional regulator
MCQAPKLPGPYTQRICVPGYWPVNTLETQRINHSAAIKFTFYAHRRHQSVIFSLNPTPKAQKQPCKSRAQITADGIQRAIEWKTLIGTNGIETRADLARYLGVSRARVTRVLKRLINHQHCTIKTADLTSN